MKKPSLMDNEKIEIKLIPQPKVFEAFRIRNIVFIDELQVPKELEIDELDNEALHFGCYLQNNLIGTARLVIKSQTGIIGRFCILKPYRKKGIGRQLLHYIIAKARKLNLNNLELGAIVCIIPFYEMAGFKNVGNVFLDAGIEHQKMILALK